MSSCTNIAVCTSGHVWAVDREGKFWFRDGIYKDNLLGDEWIDESPSFPVGEVACGGNSQVWLTYQGSNMLYHKENT